MGVPCKVALNCPSKTGNKRIYKMLSEAASASKGESSLASKRSIWVSIGTSLADFPTLGIIHQILNLKRHKNLYPLQWPRSIPHAKQRLIINMHAHTQKLNKEIDKRRKIRRNFRTYSGSTPSVKTWRELGGAAEVAPMKLEGETTTF